MIEIYLRPYVSMNVNVPIFTKHNPALQVFIKDCTEFHENPAEVFVIDCRPQTEFHENPAEVFVIDCRPQTDRQTCSSHTVLFYCLETPIDDNAVKWCAGSCVRDV